MLRWIWLMVALCGPAVAQDDLLALLRTADAVGVMRHARAPGTGDPANFRPGDCATQRNLDDTGREQARRIGARLREAGVSVPVFTSEWCRTRETAELLGMGPVWPLPALNSFFGDRASAGAQTAALKDFLNSGTGAAPVVLVTHQVNITALTGQWARSGEIVVVALPFEDEGSVLGRIAPRDGTPAD